VPPDELYPISIKSPHDLVPTPPISLLSSPLPFFLLSLDHLESTSIESKTSVLSSPCLDQTLDDCDIDRLEDDFEVKDLL